MPSGSAKQQAEINAKIDREVNPEPNQHNSGQPLRPNLDINGNQRSKFLTDCSQQHAASLRCIENNYQKKDVCQEFFDNYKKCRREERERRLAENSKRGGFFGF
jgi:hypothetical protein